MQSSLPIAGRHSFSIDKILDHALLAFVFIPHIFIGLHYFSAEGWSTSETIKYIVVTGLSSVLLMALVIAISARLPRGKRLLLNGAFTFLYLSMQGFHLLRHEPLSFILIYKNGKDIFNIQGLMFSVGLIPAWLWLVIIIGLVLLYFLHRANRSLKLLTRYPAYFAKNSVLIVLMLANIILIALTPKHSHELYAFGKSIKLYLNPVASSATPPPSQPSPNTRPWAYLNKIEKSSQTDISSDPDRPNVFIVMLESFSEYYNERTLNGKAVTPFFDQLIHSSVLLENFYSGSVETSKGQFATLCSVYPSYRSNVFTSYPYNSFHCLPEILQENGYTTVFLKAYQSLDFENTGVFVKANGFDYAHGMTDKFVTKEERKENKIGWGIRDDLFYKKTFEYLDSLQKQNKDNNKYFVKTMSVTNHMMFDDIPDDLKYIFPQASTHAENYANSMYLTDLFLKTFFDELSKRDYLKNSLVLVTGDNGFPMGQHKNNFHNTKTAYNEMFATPLLLWWPGHLEPKRVNDDAFSQLDIAPTVLDLLGIKTTNHFVGQSVFAEKDDNYFVPVVQPFDGTFLGSIRYPMKYLIQLNTQKEFLYDLSADPSESRNLLPEKAQKYDALLQRFRQDINRLHENETILTEDRVFPKSESDQIRIRVLNTQPAPGELPSIQILGTDQELDLELSSQRFDINSLDTVTKQENLLIARMAKVPEKLLGPGINRLNIKTSYKDQTITLQQDIYLADESVALLSDLDITGRQRWKSLRRNRSVTGAPITIGGESFGFGLGAHALSGYHLKLDNRYSKLHIGFGLDDASRCGDGASFEVWADGQRLFNSGLLAYRLHRDVLLDVRGRGSLSLLTLPGEHWGCDHTTWTNPVLYRDDEELGSLAIEVESNSERPGEYVLSIDGEYSRKELSSITVKNRINNVRYSSLVKEPKLSLPASLFDNGGNHLEITLGFKDQAPLVYQKTFLVENKRLTSAQFKVTKATQDYKKLKRSRTVDNKKMTINGKEYKRGLGTHSNSQIELTLGKKYHSFYTGFGLDDSSTCGDGAIFKIYGDGTLLYYSDLVKNGEFNEIAVNVDEVNILKLAVDKNQHYRCDYANWVNALLAK